MTYSIINLDEFEEAVATEGAEITLAEDLIIDKQIACTHNININLDEHKLTIAIPEGLYVSDGVCNIQDGDIETTCSSGVVVTGKGTNLNLNNIGLTGPGCLLYVKGRGNATVTSCDIIATSDTAIVVEGATIAKQNSSLTVTSTLIKSADTAVDARKRGFVKIECSTIDALNEFAVDENSTLIVDEDADGEEIADDAVEIAEDVTKDNDLKDEPEVEVDIIAEPEPVVEELAVVESKPAKEEKSVEPVITTKNVVFKKPTQVYSAPSKKFKLTSILGPAVIINNNVVNNDSQEAYAFIKFIKPGVGGKSKGYVLASDIIQKGQP